MRHVNDEDVILERTNLDGISIDIFRDLEAFHVDVSDDVVSMATVDLFGTDSACTYNERPCAGAELDGEVAAGDAWEMDVEKVVVGVGGVEGVRLLRRNKLGAPAPPGSVQLGFAPCAGRGGRGGRGGCGGLAGDGPRGPRGRALEASGHSEGAVAGLEGSAGWRTDVAGHLGEGRGLGEKEGGGNFK